MNSKLKKLLYSADTRTEEFYLDVAKIKVKLSLPIKCSEYLRAQYKNILPSAKFIEHSNSPNICVKVSEGFKGVVRFSDENNVLINSTGNLNDIVMDSILTISKLVERHLNKKQIFSMHASGICTDNKCILFIGPSGSGKTTTAAKSCITNNKIAFIDNRLLLKDQQVVAATEIFNISQGSLIYEFGYLTHKTKNDEQASKKIKLDSALLGIAQNKNYPLDIKAIIFINKLPVKFKVIKSDNINTILPQLHDSLLRYSDTFPSFILGAEKVYPQIFDIRLRQSRLNFTFKLARAVELFIIEGSLEDISEFSTKMLLRK